MQVLKEDMFQPRDVSKSPGSVKAGLACLCCSFSSSEELALLAPRTSWKWSYIMLVMRGGASISVGLIRRMSSRKVDMSGDRVK